MKTSKGLNFKPARLLALLVLMSALLAVGCRTFDYTDSDLERERQQMKDNSGGGIYQPGKFRP